MAGDSGRGPRPVYYIYGTEDYLIQKAVEEITGEALEGGLGDMNYHAFEGRSLDAPEVVSVALTVPAFSPRRVVVVKGAESIKAPHEEVLLEYVKDPSPSTVLILVASTAKVQGSRLADFLNRKGCARAYNRLRHDRLVAWIREEAARQGKRITQRAALRLADIVGTSLRDIKGELDKIAIFCGEKGEIDVGDVEDCGIDLREETVFGLSDAIGRKDAAGALKILNKVSGEAPVKILGAVAHQFRTLLKLKALKRKGLPMKRLQSALGVPPFSFNGYLERSRRFTEAELTRAMERLHSTDIDLKTGRFPQGLLLSRLVLELCR